MRTVEDSTRVLIEKGNAIKNSKKLVNETNKQLGLVTSDNELTLSALINILCGHSISDLPYISASITDSFNYRVTANGLNVVNDSYAEIQSIEGDTSKVDLCDKLHINGETTKIGDQPFNVSGLVSERTTANGAEIIDGSYAEIQTIEGDTKDCPIKYFNNSFESVDVVDTPSTVETYPVVDNTDMRMVSLCGMSKVSENLLNIEASATYRGVDIDVKGGEFIFNGTATALTFYNFIDFNLPTGTYSLKVETSGSKNATCNILFRDANSATQIVGNTQGTYTTTSDITKIVIQFSEGVVIENYKVKIMLVSGTTAPTTYVQGYTGIKNAPVSELVSEGKNLVNLADVDNDEYSIVNGILTPKVTAVLSIPLASPIYLKAGITYTFTRFAAVSANMSLRDENSKSIVSMIYKDVSKTFTPESDVIITILATNGSGNANVESKPMLVYGSAVPTTFEAYIPSSTLPISAEVQDLPGYGWGLSNTDKSLCNYIDYERKVFVQNVGSYTFTGNETWSQQTTSNGTFRYWFSGISNLYSINDHSYLPNLVTDVPLNVVATKDTWLNIEGISVNGLNTSGSDIEVYKSDIQTASAMASFMAGKTIYYQLATPVITDISAYLTNTTLPIHQGGTIQVANENADFNVKPSLTVALQGNTDSTYTGEYYEGLKNSKVTSLTSEGQNLLNIPDVEETNLYGITYSVKNGVVTLNGTATAQIIILDLYSYITKPLTLGKTHILSLFGSQDGSLETYWVNVFFGNARTFNSSSFIPQDGKTNNMMLTIPANAVLNNLTIKPMLIQGSTAPTTFKPYVAPTTIIPNLELGKWGGIYKASNELQDYSMIGTAEEITVTKNSDWDYTLNGTATNVNWINFLLNDNLPNEIYTLKFFVSGTLNGTIYKRYYPTNDITINGGSTIVLGFGNCFTITDGIGHITLQIQPGTVLENFRVKIMLVKGSIEPNVYLPYTELPYLLDNNGASYTFTGNETFTIWGQGFRFVLPTPAIEYANTTIPNLVCDGLDTILRLKVYNGTKDGVSQNMENMFVYISTITTTSEMSTFMNGKTIHYQTIEHTYTPLDISMQYPVYNQGSEILENENDIYRAIPTVGIKYANALLETKKSGTTYTVADSSGTKTASITLNQSYDINSVGDISDTIDFSGDLLQTAQLTKRIATRDYKVGDETDTSVVTDNINNTMYVLDTSTVMPVEVTSTITNDKLWIETFDGGDVEKTGHLFDSKFTSLTSTGVNLLNIPDFKELTLNGITYSIKDGVITLNGTNSLETNMELPIISGLNYTGVSFNLFSNYNNSNLYYRTSNVKYVSSTIPTLSNTSLDRLNLIIGAGATLANVVIKPMLVSGSTVPTTFKPYEELSIITPDLELGKWSGIYKASNILNISDVAETTMSGITYSIKDGIMPLNGTTTSVFTKWLVKNMQLEIGKTYILTSIEGGFNYAINGFYGRSINYPATKVITVTEPTTLGIYKQKTKGTTVNEVIKPMLVEGTTPPTRYLPYTELPYVLDNQGETITLNGTENWGYVTNNVILPYFSLSNLINVSGSTSDFILDSTEYIPNTVTSANPNDMSIWLVAGNNIRIRNTSITSVADFKTSLQNKPITIHYQTATHTYTPLDLDLQYQVKTGGNEIIDNANDKYEALPKTTITYVIKNTEDI